MLKVGETYTVGEHTATVATIHEVWWSLGSFAWVPYVRFTAADGRGFVCTLAAGRSRYGVLESLYLDPGTA